MGERARRIRVEVACALPQEQVIVTLEVAAGTCAGEAVAQSGLAMRFPQLDPGRDGIGIFGRMVAPEQMLRDGDRVEIYRPLSIDPKEARRRRAAPRRR